MAGLRFQGGRKKALQAPQAPASPSVPPRGSLRLARIGGVPVFLSASWLLIVAFITLTFAPLFTDNASPGTDAADYLLAAAFAVLSLFCVLAHEMGHALVARRFGLEVRQVYLFLLGGVTDIRPEPRTAGEEFAISAAGPAVSALVAGAAFVGTRVSTHGTPVDIELQLLVWSNLTIAAFNALPGLPLDGGRVLRSLVWAVSRSRATGTVVAAWGGRVVAIAVVVSVLLIPRHGWEFGGAVLTVVLALFLWTGASASLRNARLGARVPQLSVATLTRRAVWLPAATPLAQGLVQMHAYSARAIVVVDSAGRPIAIVNEARQNAVEDAARAWTTVGDVATSTSVNSALPLTLTGRDLLQACQAHPATEYLVLDTMGRPIGVLSAADIRTVLTTTA